MNFKILSVLLIGFLFSSHLYSQTTTVKGRVVAFRGFALNKVLIKASKSKQEVLSDSTGHFTIECKKKDNLKFKAEGFYTQVVRVKGETDVEVNMIYADNSSAFDKAVGAEHMSEKTLQHCVDNLMGDNNSYHQMKDIYQIIQFEYSGAKIGEENGTKVIYLTSRGPNSLESGGYALTMVDGIATQNLDGIDPSQVEKVNVLVGTETSEYGSRGANGVVEIFLKHKL